MFIPVSPALKINPFAILCSTKEYIYQVNSSRLKATSLAGFLSRFLLLQLALYV
jgi:hypothetical protein